MRRRRIHNYLRRCRKAQGLTQRDVAAILGLESSAMISRWEKGACIPETVNLFKMAVIYQTTVDFVYEDLRLALSDELAPKMRTVLSTRAHQYE